MISPREKQIIGLVAQGHNSKEIANQLYISQHTVDSHRQKIKRILGVKNTAGMITRSFELGILKVMAESHQ